MGNEEHMKKMREMELREQMEMKKKKGSQLN